MIIQPSHRENPFSHRTEIVHHRPPSLGIGNRGNHIVRFIKKEIFLLLRFDQGAHGFNPVFDRIRFTAQFLHYLAIHLHLPCQNQLFRFPS